MGNCRTPGKNNGIKVFTDATVIAVNQENGKIQSVTYRRSDGSETSVEADDFISSMPIKDLVNAIDASKQKEISSPALAPEVKKKIAKGLPYRDFVTVGRLVNHLNLKDTTEIPTLGNPPIVPDCWIYVQDASVKVGGIQVFNNWSPYLVKDMDNKVWIGLEYFCDEGDDFWNLTDEQAVEFAIRELTQMGIIRGKNDVLDSHRELVKKAYPAHFDTWYQLDDLVDWLDDFGNLYCVGRNGQHSYNNQDYSMATTIEAAKDIETDRSDKKNVWQVNMEKEYHEEK